MRTQRVISIVRCHAEGEVGDVIVGGVLPPPGRTMFERMTAMQREQDGLRRLLLCEPRGSVARHINLITPPARDDCDIGMITMEPTEFVPMSGSNLICTVTVALERLLGHPIDLAAFYRFAARDSDLGPLVRRFRGMKPPRFPSVFEGVVNGIACQQLSLTLGIHLLNRLAANHGLSMAANGESSHAFPRPEDLANLVPETLRPLGFSRQKGRAMVELAQIGVERHKDLEGLRAFSDRDALTHLTQLRGVGRWTAEYVLLRCLGRLNMFPGDDVGARNNLQRWLGLEQPLDYAEVGRVLARWQPYQGLVYFHLLLERLAEVGRVRAGTSTVG